MSDPDLSPAEQEAVRWCVKRHSGDWSTADEVQFDKWFATSEANRQSHRKVARAWSVAGQLSKPDTGARSLRGKSHRPVAFALLALAVLVPFVAWEGGRWWYGTPETVATTRGQFKTLNLPDGSELRLDADSEAVVRVGYRGRSAELVRGAALFVVRHDEARPFEVKAGDGRIIDLGTRFDVDIRSGHVQIEVYEGRVAMHTASGESELVAGQGAGYAPGGVHLPVIPLADTAPAWSEGRLVFRDEPLDQVLKRFSRYHTIDFALGDPSLARLRISGVFRTDSPAAFLRTLEAGFALKARKGSDGRVILERSGTTG